MSASQQIAWEPTSDEDKSLKDGLSSLHTSINTVVKNVEDDKVPSRFILNSRGYFDLRAYVMSGKDLPRTVADFYREIPEKVFEELKKFDSTIYQRTKETMVGIGASCGDYYDNHLTGLVTAAETAIRYSDDAMQLLTIEKGTNLKYHLNILLQDKYRSPAHQDEAFAESREAAVASVELLKDDALSKKQEVDKIREKLLTLKATTEVLRPGLNYITKQYKTGPVENASPDSAKKKPYLDQLDADYTAALARVAAKIQERQTKIEDSESTLKAGMGISLVPGIGFVGSIILLIQGAALETALTALDQAITNMRRDNAEKSRLIINMNMMIGQCIDVERKIGTALEAMAELSELFREHANCYDKIGSYLNGLQKGVTMGSGTIRRQFVMTKLDGTVERLKELKKTAEEFSKDAVREVKL